MEPGSMLSEDAIMEKFIHRENLALYRKRLAEPLNDAQREVLLKLLAAEQAKEPVPKNEKTVGLVETTQAKRDEYS